MRTAWRVDVPAHTDGEEARKLIDCLYRPDIPLVEYPNVDSNSLTQSEANNVHMIARDGTERFFTVYCLTCADLRPEDSCS
ncbi:MAG: hypothetical protein JWM21_2511 [Acidobacteria bacterium]|nr:hypothetical protein [Acidobacteriota bacterium]